MSGEIQKAQDSTPVERPDNDQPAVQPKNDTVAKKDGVVKKLFKKLKKYSVETILTEGVLLQFLPKLKPMIDKARPRLLNYLMGHNEEDGSWSLGPDGEPQERIIVARLTPNQDDVMVLVYKKRLTKIVSPKGYEEEAIEELHSAEDWLAKTLLGENAAELLRKEVPNEQAKGSKSE